MTDNGQKGQLQFLTLSYNRFYDLYEEIFSPDFFEKEPWYRYQKIKDAFSIYSELLNYEPLKKVIEFVKSARPPMEAEISSDLFRFVRNVILHFPFFEHWDEVWISKSLVNWKYKGQSIDKFLDKYRNHQEVKYRFIEPTKNEMVYLPIRFPQYENEFSKIYLKELLTEKEGVKFSLILMRRILGTQVKSIDRENTAHNIG